LSRPHPSRAQQKKSLQITQRKTKKKPIYFRRFGFELEFSTPFDDVAKIVKNL
jgi:hypothetical protein